MFHIEVCAGGAPDHCILCWQIWFGEPVICGECGTEAPGPDAQVPFFSDPRRKTCQLKFDESWALVCQASNASVESVLPRALQGRRNSRGNFQFGMANPTAMQHVRVPAWRPGSMPLPAGCTKKIIRLFKLDGLNRILQSSQGSFEAFQDDRDKRHEELTEGNMVEPR